MRAKALSGAWHPLSRWALVGTTILAILATLRFFGGIGSSFSLPTHGSGRSSPRRPPTVPATPPMMAARPPLRAAQPLAGGVQLFLNDSQTAGPYPLDLACFDAAGSPLSCSPSWCANTTTIVAAVNIATCNLTASRNNYTALVSNQPCRVCTRSSDARCSSAALKATYSPFSSVFAAFCNDAYLVVYSSKAPAGTPNLDNVPNPPGGLQPGTNGSDNCVTRSGSVSPNWGTDHFPLQPTLLPAAALGNNYGIYTGAANGQNGPLYNAQNGTTYWLPASGRVGAVLSGQDL